ncbi:MAG: GH39 family glycosyl hydrolase [Acidimicrobiia bacterium]
MRRTIRGLGGAGRPGSLAVVLCIALVLGMAWAVFDAPPGHRPPPVTSSVSSPIGAGAVRISVRRGAGGPAARLEIGVTHTQTTADAWRNPLATARAHRVLLRTSEFQNQSIMGWGALNPEPSPGVYDWTTLDRRLALIRRGGGTPVITLCCAPDWMKGGTAGRTDWSRLEEAPDPSHYGDFAALAATVARRYPDVQYFQVWNELKGFYDERGNHWDAAGYTELYNRVYDAVKKVRPTARIGGPYVVLESSPREQQSHPSEVAGPWGVIDQRGLDVIDYWLARAHGADFLSVDMRTMSRDGGLATDEFTATDKFAAIDRWLAARSKLPIWWSEWYVQPKLAGWSGRHQDAVMTRALMAMATSGASVALVWQPEGGPGSCMGCLWSDTARSDGGEPTPFARSLGEFVARFPPGSKLVQVSAPTAPIAVLASAKTILLVNTSPKPVEAAVNDRSVPMRGYEVRYLERAP